MEPSWERPSDSAKTSARSETDGGYRLLGYAAAVRSWRARFRGDAPGAVEHARRALALLPEEDLDQRSFAASGLGMPQDHRDLVAAIEAFAEAGGWPAPPTTITGCSRHGSRARVQWSGPPARSGGLFWARAAFRGRAGRRAAARLRDRPHRDGCALYECDELDEAERELEEGVGLAERTREVGNLVWGHIILSRRRLAQGDEEGAFEAASEAERVAESSGAD